ncbi:single-stranded-DNA-specific exonuclease RecJ [Roseomonas sp. E05]|uniref:single-stranded-DNA-specific exonuclease RecJ n=1 Tax=Roseomonas sp. E05 TaxID=3046310 RepID=UPI0024BBC761|nr:single-stranded-DNA-specific exonuclease RecJ [Roseomonas sp. E05]MDJ0389488.1 single-stranded-DNA-specific exonuclease RecJ [Roseomonas sp. E05]
MPEALAAALPEQAAPVLGVACSALGRRWTWRQADARAGLAIAQRLALPELLGHLLSARGVAPEQAQLFLEPTLRALLPDPCVLIDMDRAAERLAQAVRDREQVAVFGDYDVDGACAGALMTRFLRDLGCHVRAYVPDRLKEGYGPNATAIAALCAEGAGLVVCVDCGIAAHEALKAAEGRAEVVVLDHHKAEGPVPVVAAAVNPNRLDCTSGLRNLCAAAVSFMAAVATLRVLRRSGFFSDRPEPNLLDFLDLVALATVCDVMPLTGLNRAFVAQGLKVMARGGRVGIAALLEVVQARDAPSAYTLGFLLGPRINASGRIGEPDLGLRLLTCDDPIEARAIAERLDVVNRRRQEVESAVLAEAFAQAQAQSEAGHPVLLVCGDGWHPGVVGIVAGRVKERFNRPVCVAGVDGGLAKGSGRSVPGVDLGAAIIAARQSGLLETGGGHAMAAGFSFRLENREACHAFLNERLAHAAALPASAELVLDGTLLVPAASADLATQIARLGPFGPGNEEPAFAFPRVRIVRADRVGKEGNTVRAFIEGEGGGRLKAICFRAKEGPLADVLLGSGGAPVHLAGTLRAESWNGTVTPGLHLQDAARA